MAIIKDKIEENEMRQTINLKEVYKRTPTTQESSEFAELARDLVISRSQTGKKRGGGKFKKYSPAYAEYKGTSTVDLTLFGDMLNSVEAGVRGDFVDLFINDELETKKGYNHHVGDTLPSRPWFGLEVKEVKKLAEQVKRVQGIPELLAALGTASRFQRDDEEVRSILTDIGLGLF